jgi:hypothetical protein
VTGLTVGVAADGGQLRCGGPRASRFDRSGVFDGYINPPLAGVEHLDVCLFNPLNYKLTTENQNPST